MYFIGAIPASGSPFGERVYTSFHAFVCLTGEAQAVFDTRVGAVPAREPIDAALEHALLEGVVGGRSSHYQSRGKDNCTEMFHDDLDVTFVAVLVIEF